MLQKPPMLPTKPSSSSAKKEEDAKRKLLLAGLEVFAKHGYEAASTRMLASKAGVNLAAIPYYFGGKEGLYCAVIQLIADRIREIMQAKMEQAEALLEKGDITKPMILELLGNMLPGPVLLFTGPEANYAGPIIASEQQQPTAAFSILYESYIRRVHELGTRLVAKYLDIPEDSPEAIIRTHAIAGQMFIFMGARATILRRLGVDSFSEQNVKLIQQIIAEQVRATLRGLETASTQANTPQEPTMQEQTTQEQETP
jgi:AcrR family transcriptional regulator